MLVVVALLAGIEGKLKGPHHVTCSHHPKVEVQRNLRTQGAHIYVYIYICNIYIYMYVFYLTSWILTITLPYHALSIYLSIRFLYQSRSQGRD